MESKKRVLLVTSAAPAQSPFSTTEKRPPLGIGYLISILRNAGHEVFFIDNYLHPSDFLESDYLRRNRIEYVGIYANTICYRDTLRMLYRLEHLRYTGKWKGKIIVGGPHTTVAPDTIPDFVDFIVQGEGERVILDIVEARAKERLLCYPPLDSLDTLPMPAWDYFIHQPYSWGVNWFSEKPVFTMNTSRGCPFRCSFCSVGAIWGKRYTYFGAERIVEDIEHVMKQYGARGIYFREDNFTLHKQRLQQFCALLLEKNISMPWACETRVNTLDRETVALMQRAGAQAFYFGVESGSQRILDFLNKGIKVEQTKEAFSLCREFGIKTAASIITGVPTETEEDVRMTAELLAEIRPTVTWYNVFVGIPDSPLCRRVKEENLYEFIDDRGLVYLKGHDERVARFYRNQWHASIPFSRETPAVSTIMAVYNGSLYLEEAVRSVLRQTYQDFEFIVIDDASTDNTGEILRSIGDVRMRVVTNAERLGLTKSLNVGIGLAKGRYLARMDADDLSLPHRFEQQVRFLDRNPEHAVVGSSYYQIDGTGRRTALITVPTEDCSLREGLKNQNWFGHGSVMMRRDMIGRLGGYDERFKFAQDYDLWLRVAEKHKVANIEEPLYCWRSTDSCISRKKGLEQRQFAERARAEARRRAQPSVQCAECPCVSVIIPTFNRPGMLEAAVKSVLEQTFRDFEIIVVNDAGEEVEKVIAGLNSQANITYLRHAKNMGLAAARNTGIRIARGRYVALLDDDDIFYPDHLETAVSALNEGSKVVYTDAVRATFRGSGGQYELCRKHIPYSIDYERPVLLIGNIAPVNCFVFERGTALGAGLFDERLSTLEDWEFWIRLSALSPFTHVKRATVQVNWRTDGTSMTSSRQDEFKKNREIIYHRNREEIGKIADVQKILSMFQAIWEEDLHSGSQSQAIPSPVVKGLVSIVILTFNQLRYTKECLDSIEKHTPEPHEIIFVDNGSTDGTVKWLRKLAGRNQHYRLIENRENFGFAKGCNQGTRASSGEYILLLNNDVVVTEGWLVGLLDCLRKTPDAGIVGPMTNHISGIQQLAGIGYSDLGQLDEFARTFRQSHAHRRISHRRIVGFCMLFRRDLVERIGLLDEGFGTGNFEDDDFCLRAEIAGFRNMIAGDVFIHHYGSRSFAGNRIDHGSTLSGNRRLFNEKWNAVPAESPLGRRLLLLKLRERAEEHLDLDEIEESVELYLKGIKLAPDEFRLFHSLAEILIERKKYAEALGIFQGMPGKPDDPMHICLEGHCREGLDEIAEAEASARKALARDPSHARALNLLGLVAYKRGDVAAAEAYFREAIEADPGHGEPHANLGVIRWSQERSEEALSLLERAFVASPRVPDHAAYYHSALTAGDAAARGEAVFREAQTLHPLNRRITFLLVDLLLRQGRYGDAMDETERAMITFGIDGGMLNAALALREKTGPLGMDRGATKRRTVSLCMIVRNEERYLARCLMSAKQFVDEMIVVDTGSDDRTSDIARAFGAQVFPFPWGDDFSSARNFAMAKASGDWIFVLDGDEILAARDIPALQKLTRRNDSPPVAYAMTTRNYSDIMSVGWKENDGGYPEEKGTGWYPSTKARLFPRDERVRFEGSVHELVEGSLARAGIRIKDCAVPIHHYGKLETAKSRNKGEAYYQMGRDKLRENPTDLKALTELAVQAGDLEKFDEAIELWERVVALAPRNGKAYLNLVQPYFELERFDDALTAAEKALELDPDRPEALLNCAITELYRGNLDRSSSFARSLLDRAPGYPPALGVLGVTAALGGAYDEAISCLSQLRAKGYNVGETISAHARRFLKAGREADSMRLLEWAREQGYGSAESLNMLEEIRMSSAS